MTAICFLLTMAFNSVMPVIESNLEGYNIDDNPFDSTGLRISELFASKYMVQVIVKPCQTNVGELFGGIDDVGNKIMNVFPGSRVESINKAAGLLYRKTGMGSPVKDMLIAALDIPLAGNLVSSDTASFLMVVFVDNVVDFDPDIFDLVIGQKYRGIESMAAISQFHLQSEIKNAIIRDYQLLLPVILLVICAFVFYSYRSISAVVFCLINIGISFVSVIFFLTIFDVYINLITATALPIVVILSLSGSIHLLTGYFSISDIPDTITRIHKTLNKYLVPSLLSSLTTAIAFGSFMLSDSHYVRQFGLVTACSVITVFFLTYTISPLTLRYALSSNRKVSQGNFTRKLESVILKHKKFISIGFLSVFLISIFFVSHVTFRTNLETYTPRNTSAYNNTIKIREAFHSLAEIDMLIEINHNQSDSAGLIPGRGELLSIVRTLSSKIADYPEVSSVESFIDQLDFENQYALPGIRTILFSRSRNPFVSSDQRKYRINIKLIDPEDIRKVSNRLESDFIKYEPQFRYSIYSDFLFFDYINSSLTSSLLKSLMLSAILIIIIIFLLTCNIRITAISILANLVPLGFLVMIFVIGGIDVNITTSVTMVVCLGMIVDDTIHILYRRVRLVKPIAELGFGILTSSLILMGGFFTFILSQSRPNQTFGLLCAAIFIIAAVSDLTVIPWLDNKWKAGYRNLLKKKT